MIEYEIPFVCLIFTSIITAVFFAKKKIDLEENYYYKNGLLFEDISEFERYLGEVVDAGNKADVEYAVMDYEYNRYDIQSIVGGLGYYGSYAYRITRDYDNVVDGYNVIRIKLK